MEDTEIKGLVVRETRTGEADKILTLLTGEMGRITVTGKGAASLRCRYAPSAGLFSYSSFMLREKNGYRYIKDADLIESFMGIRYDVERLALAAYVCDLAADMSPESNEDPELLRLTLNTLYALSERQDVPAAQIKGAYELKCAVIEWYMPELGPCGICGGELGGPVFLDVMNGTAICDRCAKTVPGHGNGEGVYSFNEFGEEEERHVLLEITPDVLSAMRYVVDSGPRRFLSFTLDSYGLLCFSNACEQYLLHHIGHGYASLDYYKKVRL